MPTPDYHLALEALTAYTLSAEEDFAIAEMVNYDNAEDWVVYILSDTVFGAATVVSCGGDEQAIKANLFQFWNDQKSDKSLDGPLGRGS